MLPNPAKCHTMQHQDFRYCYNNIQHQLKLRLEYGGTAQGALELNQSVEMCTTERVLELNLSDTSAEGDGLGEGAGMLTSPQIPTNPL